MPDANRQLFERRGTSLSLKHVHDFLQSAVHSKVHFDIMRILNISLNNTKKAEKPVSCILGREVFCLTPIPRALLTCPVGESSTRLVAQVDFGSLRRRKLAKAEIANDAVDELRRVHALGIFLRSFTARKNREAASIANLSTCQAVQAKQVHSGRILLNAKTDHL